jgi:hypothetical protein
LVGLLQHTEFIQSSLELNAGDLRSSLKLLFLVAMLRAGDMPKLRLGLAVGYIAKQIHILVGRTEAVSTAAQWIHAHRVARE